jgi:hypothetical protein
VQNTLTALSQGDGEGGMCSTHSIGMWVVIEKKKGLRGLKIPKRRLSLVFAVGRRGKSKKMFFFYIPPYFL